MTCSMSCASVEMRLMVTGALHAGILQWVATGRDLTPILASMSLARRLMISLGVEQSTEISCNPLAIYARLSAPERATVRELSKSLGLDHHHAALCELSSDEA